jgi:hypothetical protein
LQAVDSELHKAVADEFSLCTNPFVNFGSVTRTAANENMAGAGGFEPLHFGTLLSIMG